MNKDSIQIQPAVSIQIQPAPALNQQSQSDEEDLKKFSEHCVRLDFQKVCLDVKTPYGIKRILNNVSGYICPGEIMYIMGPSGSGKTTLLDFLCNRTKTDPQNFLYMNGLRWKESQFRKVARYCQQYPLLYEILTVEETLEYSAKFATENKVQTSERVNNAISLLGLQNQRKTKIGGSLFRGISGGQKKRVSIGEELVANPKILFLDEPTSGLDSASTYQLMENLKQICRKTGICVIASIHQPSQRVFEISDRLLILAGGKGFGGNVAYFGKTNKIDRYIESAGVVNDTKASTSEWILDQVNGDFGEDDKIQGILDFYINSEQYKELQQIGLQLEQQSQDKHYIYQGGYAKQSSYKDIMTIVHRGYKNNFKNPLALSMRVVVYCAMAVVIGSVWWQVGDDPDAGDIQDINGVLYFSATFFMVMTLSVLPNNIEDRQIMVKEKTNGAYQLYCYSVAIFLVSVPTAFFVSALPGLIVHYMLGFPSEDAFMFVLNLFVCIMAAEGLMLIVSTIFDSLLICIVLVAQILGSFMIMNGFFIKKSNIPDGWIWLHYSAFNTYTFQNFMHLIYGDLVIRKNLDIVPPAEKDFSGELVLEDLDIEDADEFWNYIFVIGFIIVFRIIAHIYSRYKHTGKK